MCLIPPYRLITCVVAIKMRRLEYTVEYGSIITLECILCKMPNPTSVNWQRQSWNNIGLRNITIDGTKYKGSTARNPSLTITNVQKKDTGSYICTAIVGGNEKIIGDTVFVKHKQGMLCIPILLKVRTNCNIQDRYT